MNILDIVEYFHLTYTGWRRMSAVRQTELIGEYQRAKSPANTPRVTRATVESSRQRTTRDRVKHRTQARRLKLAMLGVVAMLLAWSNGLRAQEVDDSDNVPVEAARLASLGLPDAPASSAAEATSQSVSARARAMEGHHWLTVPTMVLIGAEVGVRSMDAASTRVNVGNPCKCFVEANVGRLADTDARMWSYSLGVAGAVVAGSYLLHRMGWHKLERVPMMVDIAYDGWEGLGNIRIRNERPPVKIGKLPTRGIVEEVGQ